MKTDSNLQIGDKCTLVFPTAVINDCQIKEVHFSLGKVRYDVYIPYEEDHTVIENIDSVLVERGEKV